MGNRGVTVNLVSKKQPGLELHRPEGKIAWKHNLHLEHEQHQQETQPINPPKIANNQMDVLW